MRGPIVDALIYSRNVPLYPPANILRNHSLFSARSISDDRESLFSIIIPTLSDEEENRKSTMSPSIEIIV